MKILKTLPKITLISVLLFQMLAVSGCGIYRPVDAKKVDPNAKKRAEKNIQEGKGFKVFDSNRNKGGGNFEFASSNPMWRATINILEFAPFSNVDYSGGIIITDWYNDSENFSNEALKITVRFLTNEIRSDGLDVTVHKKTCDNFNKCKIAKLESNIPNEIKKAILKNAAILKENDLKNNPNKDFKFRDVKSKS